MPIELRPLAVLVVAAGQGCILGAIEILGRRGLHPEQTRRLAHMAGGASVAVLPFFLSLAEMGVLAFSFTALLAWTRKRRQLDSVHAVGRSTLGALAFPAGLFLGAWVGWGHPLAIAYGALVLAFSDPCAAAAGARFRGRGWPVPGGRKTLAGSAAFLVVAVAVGGAIASAAGGPSPGRLLLVVAVAAVLATVEASIGYGLDNLPLPPVASLLAVGWLGL